MAVITISRGLYSNGVEVAEKVAQRLGYECIARDVLLESSQALNIPRTKLARVIHDAPGVLDRLIYRKEKYIAYIQDAFVKHIKKDNMVYHGLAGHFLLKGISHVLKVRIIADMDFRVEQAVKREGISIKEALRILTKDDEQRRKWSQFHYGIDTWDLSLYDLVLHIGKMEVDDAVDIICRTSWLAHFQTMPESQKAMDDLSLACEARVRLIEVDPDIRVSANDGIILVKTKTSLIRDERTLNQMRRAVKKIPGVKELYVNVLPSGNNSRV